MICLLLYILFISKIKLKMQNISLSFKCRGHEVQWPIDGQYCAIFTCHWKICEPCWYWNHGFNWLSAWDWVIQHWKQQTTKMDALVAQACKDHPIVSKFSWLRSEPETFWRSSVVSLAVWVATLSSMDQVQNWGDVGSGHWLRNVVSSCSATLMLWAG